MPPRIVSLLPSATEIAVAVGRGEALVGRSHECDFPPFVAALPVLTSTKLEKGLTSRQIDDRVQEIVRQGLSVYEVDAEALRALKPDVILTQSQCAVCAVTPDDLVCSLEDWTGAKPRLVSLAPDTLSDAFGDLIRVGEATDALAGARSAAEAMRQRLADLPRPKWRPRVAAIEWIEPLMAGGNWIPELISAAGGEPLLAAAGEHSPFVTVEDLAAADPDVIVALPCGFRLDDSRREMPTLAAHPLWRELAAVKAGRVYLADGHHFFNRPGPRLADSAEILAAVFDHAAGGASRPDGRWLRWP